jgi:hypothetical protein
LRVCVCAPSSRAYACPKASNHPTLTHFLCSPPPSFNHKQAPASSLVSPLSIALPASSTSPTPLRTNSVSSASSQDDGPFSHLTRSLSAASASGDVSGPTTNTNTNTSTYDDGLLAAMHPGLPRGDTPPRPNSSGSGAAAGGGGGGRRGLKSPRLYRSGSPRRPQQHHQEEEEEEQEEVAEQMGGEGGEQEEAAAATEAGEAGEKGEGEEGPTSVWGGGAFDHDHPLYRRWGAPSAQAAVTATPDLLAVVLSFLVPTAPAATAVSTAAVSTAAAATGATPLVPRHRWPSPRPASPTTPVTPPTTMAIEEGGQQQQGQEEEQEGGAAAAAAAATGAAAVGVGTRMPNDEEGPRAACRTLGAFALVARLWCVWMCWTCVCVCVFMWTRFVRLSVCSVCLYALPPPSPPSCQSPTQPPSHHPPKHNHTPANKPQAPRRTPALLLAAHPRNAPPRHRPPTPRTGGRDRPPGARALGDWVPGRALPSPLLLCPLALAVVGWGAAAA